MGLQPILRQGLGLRALDDQVIRASSCADESGEPKPALIGGKKRAAQQRLFPRRRHLRDRSPKESQEEQDTLYRTPRLSLHTRQRGLRQLPRYSATTHRLHCQRVAHQAWQCLQPLITRRRAKPNQLTLSQQWLLLLRTKLCLLSLRHDHRGEQSPPASPTGRRPAPGGTLEVAHRQHQCQLPKIHTRTAYRQHQAPTPHYQVQWREITHPTWCHSEEPPNATPPALQLRQFPGVVGQCQRYGCIHYHRLSVHATS